MISDVYYLGKRTEELGDLLRSGIPELSDNELQRALKLVNNTGGLLVALRADLKREITRRMPRA